MSTVLSENRVIVISPNGTLFDLPEIIALERGLFADAGLEGLLRRGPADPRGRDGGGTRCCA